MMHPIKIKLGNLLNEHIKAYGAMPAAILLDEEDGKAVKAVVHEEAELLGVDRVVDFSNTMFRRVPLCFGGKTTLPLIFPADVYGRDFTVEAKP